MSSFLSQVFSSKVFRGSYSDEQPEINFKMEGSKQEKRRLTSLVNRIAHSSEFGRSVLERAADAGFVLSFQLRDATVLGSCCEIKKAVMLNPAYSDDRLVSTLAHEARHAEQFSRGADSEFGKRTLKTEIMYFRAMEADAQAAAAVTTMEMKGNGDGKPWKRLRKETSYVTDPLVHSAEFTEKPRATDALLGAAFKGWYDDAFIKEAYENSYIVSVMDNIMKENKEAENPYSQKESSKAIVYRMCRGVDGCYFKNEPDVLENSKFLDISPTTLAKALQYASIVKKETGKEGDRSVDLLPVRQPLPVNTSVYVGWGTCYDATNDTVRLGMIRKVGKGR